MAEQQKNLFGRLRDLFSQGVVVRHVGGKKLKVTDTDSIQRSVSNIHKDRYSRILSGTGMGGYSINQQYGTNMSYQTQRIMLFRDYDIMDADPIISSALDIYSQESTLKNEYGDTLEIDCENEDVKEILENLFYDILNISFNLRPWVRNMCKYGDHFLFIEIAEKYGVVNVQNLSVYDTIRVEGMDPANPRYFYYETLGMDGKKQKYEAYEVLHLRLNTDTNFLPYGRSIVEGARRTWKQLMLMEDAMLIHRIMRAPEKRIIKVDIGNIPPAEVPTYMQRLADQMKKVPYVDPQSGEYNLRYNMMNILEDFYIPVRGGDSGTEITNLAGLEFNSIEDIQYLRNKMMTALKIPKALLGDTEDVSGKLTLAAQDVMYARSLGVLQDIIAAELKNIAIVHLYAQGYTDAALVDFDLKLTTPSTIYEQEKINLLKEKVGLARDIQDLKMISSDWVYKNIFKFSTRDIETMRKEVAEDVKRGFRYQQIEAGESDPAQFGFPQDQTQQPEEDPNAQAGAEGGVPEGMGENRVGRPEEGPNYGQDSHMSGRDPIGSKERYNVGYVNIKRRKDKPHSPMSLENLSNMMKKFELRQGQILSESVEDVDEGTFLDLSNIKDELNDE